MPPLSYLAPVVTILTAVPLVVGWVPRNGWYGFRTARTLASDAVWYRANRIGGIVVIVAGAAWLALAVALPSLVDTPREAVQYTALGGAALLLVSVVGTILYVKRI